MKVILIDGHGETRELVDDGNEVMDAAKQYFFSPCGVCGHIAFDDEYDWEQGCCKYCAVK